MMRFGGVGEGELLLGVGEGELLLVMTNVGGVFDWHNYYWSLSSLPLATPF